MCRRPSRSQNMTVTALMPFWSVRYFRRSSWILWGATRSLRCFFAFRLSSSNSSYDSSRKLRSSLMKLLIDRDAKAPRGGFYFAWEWNTATGTLPLAVTMAQQLVGYPKEYLLRTRSDVL